MSLEKKKNRIQKNDSSLSRKNKEPRVFRGPRTQSFNRDVHDERDQKKQFFVNRGDTSIRLTQKSLCPVIRLCGSCPQLDVQYTQQLSKKNQKLKEDFRSLNLNGTSYQIRDCVPAEQKLAYRHVTKLNVESKLMPGSQKPWIQLGYYRKFLEKVVDIEDCPVQTPRINSLLRQVRNLIKDLEIPTPSAGKTPKNALSNILVRSRIDEQEMLIILDVTTCEKTTFYKTFARQLMEKFYEISGVLLNVLDKKRGELTLLAGKDFIQEKFEDFTFQFSALTPYFVNPKSYFQLSKILRELIGENHTKEILHVNSGNGFLGILLSKIAHQVSGLEHHPSELKDCEKNLSLNGINNVAIYPGHCSAAFAKYRSVQQKNPDVLLYSPQKNDRESEILDILEKGQPNHFYIAANSVEQVSHLLTSIDDEKIPYQLKLCIPVDTLPGTGHFDVIFYFQRVM